MDLSVLDAKAHLLAIAVGLDLLVGDPVYRLHPVRLIGQSLSWFERLLRSAGADGRAGGCLLLAGLAVFWVGGWSALLVLALELHSSFGAALHLFAVYSLVALGDLLKHVNTVERAAEESNLAGARLAINKLAGRDSDRMNLAACRRASIESLAENVVDGFVSPVFWYVLAGVPGIVLFKVVSTMDSMVGYKTARYILFGWCGARLDDYLNLVPARLAWLQIALAAFLMPGCSGSKAIRIGWRHHAIVPGPNAGWSEAAIAGGIQRRLVGPIWANGELVTETWIGDPADPPACSALDYRRALRISCIVAAISATSAVLGLTLRTN